MYIYHLHLFLCSKLNFAFIMKLSKNKQTLLVKILLTTGFSLCLCASDLEEEINHAPAIRSDKLEMLATALSNNGGPELAPVARCFLDCFNELVSEEQNKLIQIFRRDSESLSLEGIDGELFAAQTMISSCQSADQINVFIRERIFMHESFSENEG